MALPPQGTPIVNPTENLVPGKNYIIQLRGGNSYGSGTFVSTIGRRGGLVFKNISTNIEHLGYPISQFPQNPGYPDDHKVFYDSSIYIIDPQAGGKHRRRASVRRKRTRRNRSRSRR